jgi:hypothetical protein
MDMTYPLFAAIDAALAAHPWPDGVYMLHVAGGSPVRDTRCTLTLSDGTSTAVGAATLAGAQAKLEQARQQAREAEIATKRLRELAEANGIDLALVRGFK